MHFVIHVNVDFSVLIVNMSALFSVRAPLYSYLCENILASPHFFTGLRRAVFRVNTWFEGKQDKGCGQVFSFYS